MAFFSGANLDFINIDGTGRRTLVQGLLTAVLPSWSPDSTWPAFLGPHGDSRQLRVVDVADGTIATLAPEVTDVLGFDWRPDGETVAFLGAGGVNVVAADGVGFTQLVAEPGAVRPIRWSPQGDKLAFGWTGRGPRQLWVVDADGANRRSLGEIDSALHALDWSPDGNEVAIFAGMRTYLVSADGSDRRWLVDQSWFASWAPDGRRFAVQVLGPTIDTPDGSKRSTLQLVAGDRQGDSWSDSWTIATARSLSGRTTTGAPAGTSSPSPRPTTARIRSPRRGAPGLLHRDATLQTVRGRRNAGRGRPAEIRPVGGTNSPGTLVDECFRFAAGASHPGARGGGL